MAKHNKKRNTGLLYEFLARFIANSIVENNENKRNEAFKIINEHFRKGTELHREFRLFNALVSTTTSGPNVASSIIREAKSAARKYDAAKLDHEKSLLIRSINHRINEGGFYNQQIAEYTQYATVQQLLNEWRRGDDADIAKMAEYEGKLQEWLMVDKTKPALEEQTSNESDALVVKLMTQKINERYQGIGKEEKSIIQAYVFREHKDELVPKLKALKEQTIAGIDSYLEREEMKTNLSLAEKLSKVRESIVMEPIEEVNDQTIEHFLDIAKLKEEVTNA